MMTVSAVARLMPRPPARVDRRKQNCWAPGAGEERRCRQVSEEVGAGGGRRETEGGSGGDCDSATD